MAANVTGVFTIIDRATGPMKKMEAQARTTQRAFDQLGSRMDRHFGKSAGVGNDSTVRNMEKTERAMRDVGRGADDMASRMSRSTQEMSRHSQSSRNLVDSLGRIGGAFMGLGGIFSALKIPGMIAGIGYLVPAIDALGGGLVALLPKIGQLGGAIAALPNIMAAAAQGMATFKLAFQGVMDAYKAGVAYATQGPQAAMQQVQQLTQAQYGVADAEHGIMLANRNSRDSQIALTIARRDATRQLWDLQFAAKSAALAEQRASIGLAQARYQLQQALMTPGTTQLQIRDLRLGVKEAQLGVRQAHETRKRANADSVRATRRDPTSQIQVQMRSAMNAVTDSAYQQRIALRSLKQAQTQLMMATRFGSSAQEAYRAAMRKLSPEARGFVKQLLGLRSVFKDMSRSAGEDMFPALEKGLQRVRVMAPTLESIFRKTGGVIGRQVEGMMNDLSTPSALNDIASLGDLNAQTLSRGGRATRNMTHALIDLMVAAKPFTSWLTKTVLGWTAWVRHAAAADRANGKIARFLDRTRASMRLFGDITKNVFRALMGTFKAATPLGDKLWQSFDRMTKRWADFAQSTAGNSQMTAWFNGLYPTLHQAAGLVHDLGGAFLAMGDPAHQRGVASLLAHMRAWVPVLRKLFEGTDKVFGPALVDAITQFGKLVQLLVQPNGALTIFVKSVTDIMKLFNWLLQKIPGLSKLLGTLFTIGGFALMFGRLRKMAGAIREMASGWGLVAKKASVARDAEIAASEVPAGGVGGVGGRGGPGFFGRMGSRFGDARAAGQLERDAAGAAGAGRLGRFGAFVRGGLMGGEAGGGLLAGGIGGLAKIGLGVAGKVALPIMAIQGLFAALGKQGTFGQRAQSAAHAVSFGLIHDSMTNVDKRNQGSQYAGQFMTRLERDRRAFGPNGTQTAAQATWAARRISQEQARIAARGHLQDTTFRNPMTGQLVTQKASIRDVTQNRALQNARNAIDRGKTQLLDSRSVALAQRRGNELGSVFNVYLKSTHNAKRASADTVQMIVGHMAHMRAAGAIVLGQESLDWARQQVHLGKMSRSTYDNLKSDITSRLAALHKNITVINGKIYTDTDSAWQSISGSLTSWTEKALEGTTRGFTAMQKHAMKGLQQMGFTSSQAKDIVQGVAKGGAAARAANEIASGGLTTASTHGSYAAPALGGMTKAGATGMRIGGHGLRDTVSVAPGHLAAPGELIVNRHTERRLNHVLGMFGTTLGSEVAGERKPHYESFAGGGRIGQYNRRYPMHLTGTPGYTMSPTAVRAVAENAGFSAGRALQMAQIAHGESGYMPGIQQRDPGDHNVGYGLWQITPHAWGGGPALAYMNHLGGTGGMFNPVNNGFMAKFLYDHAGHSLSPWYGTRYLNRNMNLSNVHSVLRGNRIMAGHGGGAGGFHINAPRTNLAGVPGGMQQGAFNIYAAGLNHLIARAARNAPGAGGGGGGGTPGAAGGPAGLGSFGGMSVAKWIIPELLYARRHGWTGNITSGWRSPSEVVHSAVVAPQGHSEHQGTQYPHGAVDFGGPFDPAGLANKRAFERAARGYRGRKLLEAQGFRDDGHMSGTGHALGGRVDWGGWNAAGGRFDVSRPTVFGAGEGGRKETVTITPQRSVAGRAGKGGGRDVHFNFTGDIIFKGEGDIRKAVKKELKGVAADLANIMSGNDEEA